MFNRRAQIGETMTWIVATVIIVVVLGMTIFIASASFGNDKKPDIQEVSKTDIIASKSLFSFVLTKDSSGEIIYEQLKEDKNLNNFSGDLAERIFNDFYGEEYNQIWVGSTDEFGFGKENIYLGKKPSITLEGKDSTLHIPGAFESVNIDEKRSTELVLLRRIK